MGNSQGKGEEDSLGDFYERDVSLTQLKTFDGSQKAKAAYVAVSGEVFDVTEEKENADVKDFLGKELTLESKEKLKEIHEWLKTSEKIRFVGKLIPEEQMKKLNRTQLSKFNGEVLEENPKGLIYLSAKGFIFDVSNNGGRGFYGLEGGYKIFAGKNCQRALALTSLELSDVQNERLDDLDEESLNTLDQWIDKYMTKYTHIGYLI